MVKNYYKESDLPLDELETIGLAANGQPLLDAANLQALLAGRRTGMLQLKNLEAGDIKIDSLDAKISLGRDSDGKVKLLVHPIYLRPVNPGYLEDFEAGQLEKGEIENLLKVSTDENGNKKEILVEYDPETREFIVSDTEKIMVPDMVNGEYLTAAQKEKFRKGKEVELPDRTKFNYSANEAQGIRSNKLALVASILVDGGLSFLVYHALNAMFNKKRDPKEANKLSPGYYSALKDAQKNQPDYSENLRKARPVVGR